MKLAVAEIEHLITRKEFFLNELHEAEKNTMGAIKTETDWKRLHSITRLNDLQIRIDECVNTISELKTVVKLIKR